MQEAQDTISKRGFAELLGVSAGRVSQMIAAGLPVEPNGRIAVAAGKAWVEANVDPNRRRVRVNALPDAPRRAREAAEARIATLKAEKLADKLIDRAATLRAIEARGRMERDAWIAWVNRAAPDVARAANADLAPIVAALDRLVRDQLAALAATPLEGLDYDSADRSNGKFAA